MKNKFWQILPYAIILAIVSWAWDATSSELTTTKLNQICHHYKYHRCELLVAIAIWETRGGLNALSYNEKEEAYGLYQMRCKTAKIKRVGLKFGCHQLFSPMIATRFAVRYMEHLESLGFLSDESLVAAWNSGGNYRCKKFGINRWHGGGVCVPGKFINDSYVYEVMKIVSYLKGV